MLVTKYKLLIIFLFLFTSFAESEILQKEKLDKLFYRLSKTYDYNDANLLEKKIWAVWHKHPNNESLTDKLKSFLKDYNKANSTKKITLITAKKVVRRGMGAYSTTHRPTISGGRPNSRQAWGIARLHAFSRKKSRSTTAKGVVTSRAIKKSYTQDNDLL